LHLPPLSQVRPAPLPRAAQARTCKPVRGVTLQLEARSWREPCSTSSIAASRRSREFLPSPQASAVKAEARRRHLLVCALPPAWCNIGCARRPSLSRLKARSWAPHTPLTLAHSTLPTQCLNLRGREALTVVSRRSSAELPPGQSPLRDPKGTPLLPLSSCALLEALPPLPHPASTSAHLSVGLPTGSSLPRPSNDTAQRLVVSPLVPLPKLLQLRKHLGTALPHRFENLLLKLLDPLGPRALPCGVRTALGLSQTGPGSTRASTGCFHARLHIASFTPPHFGSIQRFCRQLARLGHCQMVGGDHGEGYYSRYHRHGQRLSASSHLPSPFL